MYSPMRNSQNALSGTEKSPEIRIYCKMFEDMILVPVCQLRRRDLHNPEIFSCSGCTFSTAGIRTQSAKG